MAEPANPEQHHVYILRDRSGHPIYVGRGAKSTRPNAHFSNRAHNEGLTEVILREAVAVEITGPLGSEGVSAIVESALISAFQLTPSIAGKLKNIDPGSSAGRFRPYGVPTKYAPRASLPALTEEDLLTASAGRPVIAVLLTKKVLQDRRRAFDMARRASDRDIAKQMDRWWPIGRERRKIWEDEPGPGLLVGMSGSPRHRVVVGALEIDAGRGLEASPSNCSRFRIPARYSTGLDFGELRGRTVTEAAGKMQESGIRLIHRS